jgi:hypothetical protein
MYIKDGSSKPYGGQNTSGWYMIAEEIARGMTKEEIIKDPSNLLFSPGIPPLGKNLYMWGWLGDKVPNVWEDETKKQQFLESLEKHDEADDYHCGFHCCEVCAKESLDRSSGGMFNGSVFVSHKDKVYRCPKGVEHYVEAHNYKPPKEVIDAIINGKNVTSKDYIHVWFDAHKDKIEAQVKKTIKERKERKERDRVIKAKRVEWERSLPPEQQSVLKRWKKGTLKLIPWE